MKNKAIIIIISILVVAIIASLAAIYFVKFESQKDPVDNVDNTNNDQKEEEKKEEENTNANDNINNDKFADGLKVNEGTEEEKAKVREKLATYSKEALGLSDDISTYKIILESERMTMGNKNCYIANVIKSDNKESAVFLVSTDYTVVYKDDRTTGDFIQL